MRRQRIPLYESNTAAGEAPQKLLIRCYHPSYKIPPFR